MSDRAEDADRHDLGLLYAKPRECAWCGVRLAEGRVVDDDGESYCSLGCLAVHRAPRRPEEG